uniref:WD repeat-containing protein 75 isoform X1-like n=1 Tax=Sus scrofa TaxID=9823 RepID=A0A481DGS3_PIG
MSFRTILQLSQQLLNVLKFLSLFCEQLYQGEKLTSFSHFKILLRFALYNLYFASLIGLSFQSLLTLSTKSPEEKLTPTSKQLLAEESLPTTPFYFILGKHRQQQQDDRVNEALENELVQLPLTENIPAISELLHTPAHVLPSASFLCSMFVNSLLLSKETESAKEAPDDVDMEEEKESDDSDEENNYTENVQDTNNTDLGEDIIHQLSKSEEKKLRKFRKVDYSWITAL